MVRVAVECANVNIALTNSVDLIWAMCLMTSPLKRDSVFA